VGRARPENQVITKPLRPPLNTKREREEYKEAMREQLDKPIGIKEMIAEAVRKVMQPKGKVEVQEPTSSRRRGKKRKYDQGSHLDEDVKWIIQRTNSSSKRRNKEIWRDGTLKRLERRSQELKEAKSKAAATPTDEGAYEKFAKLLEEVAKSARAEREIAQGEKAEEEVREEKDKAREHYKRNRGGALKRCTRLEGRKPDRTLAQVANTVQDRGAGTIQTRAQLLAAAGGALRPVYTPNKSDMWSVRDLETDFTDNIPRDEEPQAPETVELLDQVQPLSDDFDQVFAQSLTATDKLDWILSREPSINGMSQEDVELQAKR
jgi:hypothetical protein